MDYKLPYKPNELIGVFGDSKQYRVTASRRYVDLEKNQDPAYRLDPKDSLNQKRETYLNVCVNGKQLYTLVWSQPTRAQVVKYAQQATERNTFQDVSLNKIDVRSIALAAGQKGGGTGKRIIFDTAVYSARGSDLEGEQIIKNVGLQFAARGGIPFKRLEFDNLGIDYITRNFDTPGSADVKALVNYLGRFNMIKKDGVITISMKPSLGSRNLSYADEGYSFYDRTNEVGHFTSEAKRNNVTIKINIGKKIYVFKPDGTAWLNGKQVVTSILMRDQNKK